MRKLYIFFVLMILIIGCAHEENSEIPKTRECFQCGKEANLYEVESGDEAKYSCPFCKSKMEYKLYGSSNWKLTEFKKGEER